MKVVHLSTSVGVNSANTRLHQALLDMGVDSQILVLEGNMEKIPKAGHVTITVFDKLIRKIGWRLEALLLRVFYPERENVVFSTAGYGVDVTKDPNFQKADIINLHWVNNGYLSIRSLKKIIATKKPIIWTVHDSWPFTGGCHVRYGCNRFETDCSNCRMLNINKRNVLSARILCKKKKALRDNEIFFVAPSMWMKQNINKSALFSNNPCVCIPNPIDTAVFMNKNTSVVKNELLKSDEIPYYHILFGAIDAVNCPYKGFQYLVEALNEIEYKNVDASKHIMLHIFGSDEVDIPELAKFKKKFWGSISDVSLLVKLYSIADVYVLPSIDDNLPNTVMESLSCGTPVVAFRTGGIPDMIDHKQNGYLAEHKNSTDLCDGILWMYENRNNADLCDNARKGVERKYKSQFIAGEYIKIYSEMLKDNVGENKNE